MLKITIPMEGLSLNNSHMSLKRGGRIKKQSTRLYELQFNQHLSKYIEQIAEFKSLFKPLEMGIKVAYNFFYNEKDFYTKKGQINLTKTCDIDNLFKIPNDLIFKNLVNDGYILEINGRKLPTKKDPFIEVIIEKLEIPRLADD